MCFTCIRPMILFGVLFIGLRVRTTTISLPTSQAHYPVLHLSDIIQLTGYRAPHKDQAESTIVSLSHSLPHMPGQSALCY